MKTCQLSSSGQIGTWLAGFACLLAAAMMLLYGCSHTEKVLVAPKVELKAYRSIGVIEFSTNAEETLKPYVTQNFIQNIQAAQPGTPILELGDEEHLLRALGHSRLDLAAIRSIGKIYNVDAVIIGALQVSTIKPEVKVFSATKALNAKAYIEAALRTRILETRSGATLWTRATSGKTRVASIHLMEGGPVSFGFSDPEEKYGKMVPELVWANTMDFRSRYEYRKVE